MNEIHLRPQVSQKALIQIDGKVLLVEEGGEVWELPGGRVNEGETDLVAALKREVREELSLEIEPQGMFTTYLYKNRSGKDSLAIIYKCDLVSSLDDLKTQEGEITGWKLYSKEELRELKSIFANSVQAIEKFCSE